MRTLFCFLLSLAFALNLHAHGQTITKKQWDNMVDFVTIEMTKAYIKTVKETKDTERTSRDSINKLSNSVENPPYADFEGQLKIGWKTTKGNLADKLQERKNLTKDKWTLDNLLNQEDIGKKLWTQATADSLKLSLQSYITHKQEQAGEGQKESNKKTQTHQGKSQRLDHNKAQGVNWGVAAMALAALNLVLLAALAVALLLLWKKNLRNYVVNTVLDSERIKNSFGRQHHEASPAANNDSKAIKELEAKLNALEERVRKAESKEASQAAQRISPTAEAPQTPLQKDSPHTQNKGKESFMRTYLGKMYRDTFTRSSDEHKKDFFFYVNKSTSEFFFDEDSDNFLKAKAWGDVVFEQTAETSGVALKDAKAVKTIAPGKLEPTADGEWKVVTKTKLLFS